MEHAEQSPIAEVSGRQNRQRWYRRWLVEEEPTLIELAPHEYGCRVCGSV